MPTNIPSANTSRLFKVGDCVNIKNTNTNGVVEDLLGQSEYRVKHDYGWGSVGFVVYFEHELELQTVAMISGSSSNSTPPPVSGWIQPSVPYTLTPGDVTYQAYQPWLPLGPTEEERKKRKLEGRCEECGELRQMSIHGLLDCPNHPSPGGPQ